MVRAWRKRMRMQDADPARLTAAKGRILRARRNAVPALEDEWLQVIGEPSDSQSRQFQGWTFVSTPAHAGSAPPPTPAALRAPLGAPLGTRAV